MVAIWSACLTPCKYPFPLKSVHFEFLTIFLIFILVAILKIFKTKSTTLSDDLFLCQVSKGSAVWFEFNIFAPWLPRQRPPFWICSTLKSCHTLRWIFLQSYMKFNERNPNFFLILPFLFPWQLRKSLSNDFDFSGLSRSTRCGCCSLQVSSISIRRVTCYDHFCVFNFFCILAVSMAAAAILKIPKVVWTSTHSA
jgi:hypothetical protein